MSKVGFTVVFKIRVIAVRIEDAFAKRKETYGIEKKREGLRIIARLDSPGRIAFDTRSQDQELIICDQAGAL